MLYGNIVFDEVPEIGFAHQHFSLKYGARYGQNKKKCVEIVYVNSGSLKITLEDTELYAPKGSVLVLFRHLPFVTQTIGDEIHSHCTVLAEFLDYDFLVTEKNIQPEAGFLIPFVTSSCIETEEIGKRLYKIAYNMAEERERNALAASVEFLSILKRLDEINRKKTGPKQNTYTKISSKVCEYVENNIEKNITMEKLARYIGKSPNHIGHAFKAEKQKTVMQYVNEQKAKRIGILMQKSGVSFKKAVSLVGICDESYGYKIFKKHIGVTPKEYMAITTIKKN